MKATLSIIEAPIDSGLQGQTVSFDSQLNIGRADNCELKLIDNQRIVSSLHASLQISNNTISITDQSTNGTRVNTLENQIPRGAPYDISDGDILFVGLYQIKVAIENAEQSVIQAAPPSQDLGGSFLDSLQMSPAPNSDSQPGFQQNIASPLESNNPLGDSLSNDNDDLDQWLDMNTSSASADIQSQGPTNNDSLLDHVSQQAPETLNPLEMLDPSTKASAVDDLLGSTGLSAQAEDDWWNEPSQSETLGRSQVVEEAFTAPVFAKPEPTPAAVTPQPSAAPARNNALTSKMGVTTKSEDELTDEVVQAMRTVTDGLISIMRLRSNIKNEMKVDRTVIGVRENNPLKFSPTADDALKLMFDTPGTAFLSANDAIKESVKDIENHQSATIIGMKIAFDFMLKQFNPERIESLAAEMGQRKIGRLGGKTKAWDFYQSFYARLLVDKSASYQQLFGDVFSQEYEKQLEKLKSQNKH